MGRYMGLQREYGCLCIDAGPNPETLLCWSGSLNIPQWQGAWFRCLHILLGRCCIEYKGLLSTSGGRQQSRGGAFSYMWQPEHIPSNDVIDPSKWLNQLGFRMVLLPWNVWYWIFWTSLMNQWKIRQTRFSLYRLVPFPFLVQKVTHLSSLLY